MSAEAFDLSDQDRREIRQIPVNLLEVDNRIQRDVRTDRCRRMADQWDYLLSEVLLVMRTSDGSLLVLDGQNRCVAAQMRNPEMTLLCVVIAPLSEQEQASLILELTRGRAGHDAYDKWKLLVASREPYAVAGSDALTARRLYLGKSRAQRTITAVGCIMSILHRQPQTAEQAGMLLGRVLDVVTAAWPDEDPRSERRFDNKLLRGLALLIAKCPELDDDRLARTIAVAKVEAWIATQNSVQPVDEQIAVTMLNEYNKRLTSRRLTW